MRYGNSVQTGYDAVQEPHVAARDCRFGARSVRKLNQDQSAFLLKRPLQAAYVIGVIALVSGCIQIKLDFRGFGPEWSATIESQFRQVILCRCAQAMAAEQFQFAFPADARHLRGKSVRISPREYCSSQPASRPTQPARLKSARLIGYAVDAEPPPTNVADLVKPFNENEWKAICSEINKMPANSNRSSAEIDATFVAYYRLGDACSLARLVLFAKSVDADCATVDIVCLEAEPCDARTLR